MKVDRPVHANRFLISLVGGQPMPNLLANLELMPATALFLMSAQTRDVYNNLQRVLTGKGVACASHLVSPFQIKSIEEACQTILGSMPPSAEVMINLTGGTKMMSIAAFAVASKAQLPTIYLNGNQLYRFDQQCQSQLSYRLGLADCLAVHGIQILSQQNGGGAKRPMGSKIRSLGPYAGRFSRLLRTMRTHYQKNNHSIKAFEHSANPQESQAEIYVLQQFHQSGVIRNYRNQLKHSQFDLVQEPQVRSFINGSWVEHFTYLMAQRVVPDEIRINAHIQDAAGAQNEIDVLLIKDNRLVAISCKTRRQIQSRGGQYNEHLQALSALTRKIGGLFSQAFLVVSEEIKPNSGDADRARSEGIQIINPKQFPHLAQHLARAFQRMEHDE